MALGVALVLAVGGVDISVAGVATISGVVFAIATQAYSGNTLPLIIGFIVALFTGLLSGGILALLVRYFRAPSLIASWAIGALWFILAVVIANPQLGLPGIENINRNVSSVDFGITLERTFYHINGVGLWATIASVSLITLLLYFSNLPRRAAAIGANRDSAIYAGIAVGKVTIACYLISAVLASSAGVITVLVNGSASTTALSGQELTAIAAAILGGTAMTGGYFRPAPVVFAALFWGEVSLLALNLQIGGAEFQAQLADGIYAIIFIIMLMGFGKTMAVDVETVHSERKTED